MLGLALGLAYLGMSVEELKQSHGEWPHPDVSILVLLKVVGHGLSLQLRQEEVGLLLQTHQGTRRTHSPTH